MVYSIYVSGTGYSGKTALCLGLFGKFQEMGFRVGYFKPVGQGQKMVEGKLRDLDVILMKEVMDLSELAKEFQAKVLLSVKGSDDDVAERAILYRDYMNWKGAELLGVVLNFVPYEQLERMRGVVSSVLERCGLEVLGVVPDHRELTNPTVVDLVDILGAEVLAGKDDLETLIEGYLVGAMSPESAMSWFRRSVGGALITGGDRTDLILTALETKPSAIVLTGNIYPSVQVLSAAEAKNIPVLLVPYDTYTTVTRLDLLEGRIVPSPTSTKKIQLTRQIIGEYVDWKRIINEYVDWKQNKRK